MRAFPHLRLRCANNENVDQQGDYVLYWMIATRRVGWNFGLQRALDWSRELSKPVLIIEPLSCSYRWAADRFHRFVLDGMVDNEQACREKGIAYHAYIEPSPGAGDGLIDALASRAALMVTDDYPAFFLSRMLRRFVRNIQKKCEVIDSNGLLPMAATDKCFVRAFDFRRFLQKTLPAHLVDRPDADPLAVPEVHEKVLLDKSIGTRWPELTRKIYDVSLASFPINHSVSPVDFSGGQDAAKQRLKVFLNRRLDNYNSRRNLPEEEGTSGLSPYLHFGHISSHYIFDRLMHRASWSVGDLAESTTGARNDWWGVDENTEALLDQLITWRELGFNRCFHRDDYSRYSSLPDWAKKTLQIHAKDPRPFRYDQEIFEAAETHDPLWNAIQRQLALSGEVHNYMRMLWGKKILEWSASPQEALGSMIHLNNKYAVDGRDPNSYSGIFWTLGRYDRAWGPERAIFGKVRYMSSENTARKYRTAGYLEKWRG